MTYRFDLKHKCCRRHLSAVFGAVLVLFFSVPFVIAETIGTQNVSLTADPADPSIFDTITIGIDYTVSTGDTTLSGIGLNLYFDSTGLNFTGWSPDAFFNTGDIVMNPASPGVQADTDNLDNDTTTDRFIPLRWASFQGNWPGQSLPVRLAELTFEPVSTGSTCVNIGPVETAAGYTAAAGKACFDITCPAPVIARFDVDADFILSGEDATLSWSTTGASQASIDNGIGGAAPPAGGSVSVHPDRTTTYTLTATNDCGSVTRTVTVMVESDLSANRPVLLSPKNGATGVSLMPELKTAAGGSAHAKTRWQIAVDQPRFEGGFIVYDEISSEFLNRIVVPPDMLLEKETRYYWRVMFHDGTQWTQPSAVSFFETVGDGPVYIDGIRAESRLDPEEAVKLGALFTTEAGAPVNTDTLKVFRSAVRPEVQIGLKTDGAVIEKCGAVHPDALSDYAEKTPDLPFGLIELYLVVPGRGDSAEATLYFSEPMEADFVWWKYDPNRGEFYDYQAANPGALQVSPDRLSLKIAFTDGGQGDLIANPDGRIIDPSGPGGELAGSGGGGGGTCFIGTSCR